MDYQRAVAASRFSNSYKAGGDPLPDDLFDALLICQDIILSDAPRFAYTTTPSSEPDGWEEVPASPFQELERLQQDDPDFTNGYVDRVISLLNELSFAGGRTIAFSKYRAACAAELALDVRHDVVRLLANRGATAYLAVKEAGPPYLFDGEADKGELESFHICRILEAVAAGGPPPDLVGFVRGGTAFEPPADAAAKIHASLSGAAGLRAELRTFLKCRAKEIKKAPRFAVFDEADTLGIGNELHYEFARAAHLRRGLGWNPPAAAAIVAATPSAAGQIWSPPMPKKELALRVDMSPKAFRKFAKVAGIRELHRGLAMLRLDGLPEKTRERFFARPGPI